jgi:hypothetical protein
MRARLARAVPRVLLIGLLFVARAVNAAPCGRPDVDATYPPHDAVGVPPNALLSAHYAAPAEYVDEVVTVTGPAGAVPVDVFFDRAESMLGARPLTDLAAGGPYVVTWPGLRGVTTSTGLGLTVEFNVGNQRDEQAPRFDGFTGIDWDWVREEDECTETHEDRFWFDLDLGSVSDDLSPSFLSVLVFETRGPSSGSAPEQIAVRPMPKSRTVRVERPAAGGEKVCFAAVVRDLTNRVSGGGDEQVCVETTELPFFEGCSLAARRSRGGGAVSFLVASSLVVVWSRRRARRA